MKKKNLVQFLALVLGFAACTKAPTNQVLRLSIWPSYISEEIVAKFEKENNVKVEVSNFSTNEELYAKLKAGGAIYDLVVPTDYMVETMVKEGMLEELGSGFAPAIASVDAAYLDKYYDKGNKYSVPYAWTATGIAYVKDAFKDGITSWKQLFTNPKVAGKVALLDDAREVVGAALRASGHSMNTTADKDLADATKLMKGVRSRVKLFTSEPYLALENKEITVAQIFSSDALKLRREGKLGVEFVIPDEGCTIGIDNFAIPKGSKNKELAEKFVAFVLNPAQYKVNFEAQLFGPVVKGLSDVASPELKNDPVLFPKQDRVAKLEQMQDLGEGMSKVEKIWTDFKAE